MAARHCSLLVGGQPWMLLSVLAGGPAGQAARGAALPAGCHVAHWPRQGGDVGEHAILGCRVGMACCNGQGVSLVSIHALLRTFVVLKGFVLARWGNSKGSE